MCEYEQRLASRCHREGMREGRAECTVREEINTEELSFPSGALVFEVGLFDASAEGQQVAVALDPLCQLGAGQSGGQDGEEVTEHQRIQFCRSKTHRQTHSLLLKSIFNYFHSSYVVSKVSTCFKSTSWSLIIFKMYDIQLKPASVTQYSISAYTNHFIHFFTCCSFK